MKKFIFLFAMLLAFSFTASAQFSFTSKAGKKFSVSSTPQNTDYRGSTSIFDYYYTVEDSDLVVYEVVRDDKNVIREVRTVTVPLDTIEKDSFKVRSFANMWILQTGKPYTRYTHAGDFDSKETSEGDNLQLNFEKREVAEAFRAKVLGDELGIGDLDLDLSDKPKEKPKSTMPAHLFAFIGGGTDKRLYQFSRKTDELWDVAEGNVVKVGKIAGSGEDLQLLDKTDSFFVYKLKNNRLYNGDKATAYSLIDDSVCKTTSSGKCDIVYKFSREDEKVYYVASDGTKYQKFKIMGEASNEEMFIILALMENLR